MPLTWQCSVQWISSALSLALTGRSPGYYRFTALIFVYGTFKGRALWHRSPVYISTALEGKKWHEFFNAPCAVARSPGLLQFHLLWAHCDWLQRVLEEADFLWVKKSSWANWAGQEKLIVYLFVNMLTVNLPFFSIRILYPAVQLFAN